MMCDIKYEYNVYGVDPYSKATLIATLMSLYAFLNLGEFLSTAYNANMYNLAARYNSTKMS